MAEENNFKSTVKALFEGMDSVVSSKTVVGDAIHINGTIILPLVDVSFGIGAGSFLADKKEKGMGGMGGRISPSAVIVIQDGRTKLVNIKNQDTITKILDMIPDVVDRFTSEKEEKMTEKELVTFRRQNVGFIFQSYNLIKTMNAVENVAMPLSFRGVPKKIRVEKAKKYLKLVGLEKQMDHMANEMSGGQQQRVGIARALVMDPRIIFADEPTGNLDSKTTMDVLQLMRRIVRERKQTLIMVTHDNYLAGFADKQIHIVDGKILKIEEKQHEDEEEQN